MSHVVTSLLAAGATGLTVWWWLPPARFTTGRRRVQLPGWLRSRPGAMPRPRRLAVGLLAGAAAALLVPGAAGLVTGAAMAVLVALVLGRLEPGGARRGTVAVAAAMPETLELLASALDAGLPIRAATAHLARMGPPATRPAMAGVVARVQVGVSDADAWRALAQEPPWARVALDVARSCDTGTAAAQVLRQHAEETRNRRRDALLAAARAVGVRSTLPLMGCFLPAFLLVGVVPVVAGLVTSLLHR